MVKFHTFILPLIENYALIIGNGEIPKDFDINQLGKPCFILAADGGAENAKRLGLKLNGVIGDLDSLSSELLLTLQKENVSIHLVPSQNLNDLEKAIRFLRRLKIDKFTLLGFTGRRFDQTLATLCVCKKFQTRALFRIFTEDGELYIGPPGEYQIQCSPQQIVSLFGFPQAKGITTHGLKYELKRAILKSSSKGVSNQALQEKVIISWRKGTLIIFLSYK